MHFKKVGGLRFLRLGRLNVSWSIKRATPATPRAKRAPRPRLLGMDYLVATSLNVG